MNQHQHHDIQIGGRGRRIRRSGAAALLLGGVALALTPAMAGATTGSTPGTGSTQVLTFTPSALLTIAAPAVSLGNGVGGAGISPATLTNGVSLGTVAVTNSLADGFDWSASVAASNCYVPSSLPSSLSNLNTNIADIPASALTLTTGSGSVAPTASLDATAANRLSAALGSGGAFAAPASQGSVLSPTFGTAQSLASTNGYSSTPGTLSAGGSDYLANDGVYNFSPTVALNDSGSNFAVVGQLYTCNLQYTILG